MFWSTLAEAGTFMPPQAGMVARHVDALYGFLVWASVISFVLVIGGLVYFTFKYRRKSDQDKTAYISHNNVLEFLWSFIPFLIFMVTFGWGMYIYVEQRTFAKNSLEILVQGQKWNWTFMYKSGKVSPGELWVPENTPIKLIMTSKDVIHSVFLPAFRLKQDAVPGRYTALGFTPEKKGNFQIFCTEYCGDQHSGMLAKMKVVSREEFDQWLSTDAYKGLSLADIGQNVFKGRCVACHSLADQKVVGPGWKGLFGKARDLADGSKVEAADENYLRESILNPNAKVVAGFPAVMPTFAGQLNEQEISGVIEFIKTLK